MRPVKDLASVGVTLKYSIYWNAANCMKVLISKVLCFEKCLLFWKRTEKSNMIILIFGSCNYRDGDSSFESFYCFLLLQNTLVLKSSVIQHASII